MKAVVASATALGRRDILMETDEKWFECAVNALSRADRKTKDGPFVPVF